jgi:hypothetical protein
MQTRAPKGQYRVTGLDPIDTLTWPSGPLWKDCETLDEALDLADHNRALYLWVYVYDDAGVLLHETGCHPEQLERIRELHQKPPEGPKTKP